MGDFGRRNLFGGVLQRGTEKMGEREKGRVMIGFGDRIKIIDLVLV